MKNRVKRIRKPNPFGVSNQVNCLRFIVNKDDECVEVETYIYERRKDLLTLSPRSLRFLARYLTKSAEYLEKR